MLELCASRQKPPSVATPTASSSCASMPAGAASRYALGAGGVGAARPAPAASLISASRYALGARRTALRAEGAARLCARRRSRWLPSPPRATRSAPRWRAAPGAWAPIRQPGRGPALRARRRRRGRCGVRAPAPAPQGGRKRRNKIRTTRRNITSNKYIPVQSAHATYVPRLLRLSTSLACAARRGKSVYLGLSRPGSHLPSA